MIYYISNGDIPGKKAHTIQQLNMCQAFASSCEEVTLVHPSYGGLRRTSWEEAAEYYGLETKFTIETVPSLESQDFVLSRISRAAGVSAWILREIVSGRLSSSDVIYSRNYYPTLVIAVLLDNLNDWDAPRVYYEYHDVESMPFKNRFFRSVDGVICITRALKNHLVRNQPISADDCRVWPDAVDPRPYRNERNEQMRAALGLPQDANIVLYTGHLYDGKGGEVLVEAAKAIDAEVYLVGGYESDVERFRSNGLPSNVSFTGFVEPAQIPAYQTCADVLVAPYTWNARPYLSPLKIFEYMAAGNPMVVSRLPVLEEVLTDEKNALLVEPGDETDLANAVNLLLSDEALSDRLSNAAARDVAQYTWKKRAKDILEFIEA